ncbi:uncharacterized protein LOC143378348 [Andrena cerasifolii]|uniref:uncharacterized protein LOC143378348 n=1 Tax=Andrena cerasifolii TaxID=2819439 RepID=UPI0040378C76
MYEEKDEIYYLQGTEELSAKASRDVVRRGPFIHLPRLKKRTIAWRECRRFPGNHFRYLGCLRWRGPFRAAYNRLKERELPLREAASENFSTIPGGLRRRRRFAGYNLSGRANGKQDEISVVVRVEGPDRVVIRANTRAGVLPSKRESVVIEAKRFGSLELSRDNFGDNEERLP